MAGTTRITPREPHAVDRPLGMDAWIIHRTVAGRGRINRGAAGFTAVPGDLLLWPPRTAHDYGADAGGTWTHLWIYVHPRPAWLDRLGWPDAGGGVGRLRPGGHPAGPDIAARFDAVLAAYAGPGPDRLTEAMAWTELLLIAIDRVNPLRRTVDPRIQDALDRIERDPAAPVRVPDLARRAGLSPSRFAHLFRHEVGVPPLAWAEERRTGRARDLLRATALPVAAVARMVGYDDPAYFARVFRRRSGCSPVAFRRGG